MKKITLLVPGLLLLIGGLASCSSNDKASKRENHLVIYNCQDYIDEELIEEFKKEYNCTVSYQTYDTNETMYNQFTLQPEGTYDLICTSDYMIQKMVREGLVQPFSISELCPNYDTYASKEVRSKLASMMVDIDGDGEKETSLDEYSAGYMWGTLGVVYDPNCSDTINEDVKSWNVFWNEAYKNTISIKNSMRDTFVVGLMHAYSGSPITNQEDILNPAREAYLAALENATTEEEKAQVRASYNQVIQDLFDILITEENYAPYIDVVKKELISLKENIFGFEVDNGKNDIVTGKIKMNLAWSGDAVFSIENAREEANKELAYYVPDEGSNVWYDGWSIPKGGNKDLACKFIDFLSRPDNAARNMDYIGYTSFIACDDVFDLVTDWYGVGDYFEGSTYHGAYEDEEEGEVEGSIVFYEGKAYQCKAEEEISDILPTNTTYWTEIDADELGVGEAYDLSHLFGGNVSEGRNLVVYPYEENANLLETQYPSQEIIARCAIMNDFGSANDDVIIMWGQIRAYTNMMPYYIFLLVVVFGAFVIGLLMFIKKQKSLKIRRRLAKK